MKKLLSNFAIAFLAPILTLSAFLIVQTAILPALSHTAFFPTALTHTAFFPTAHADTQNWSEEVFLTGQTSAVLVNGVNNSGITDFNLLGADENLKQYRAKLVRTAEPFTDGNEVYEMQGWAWNDNLGWVSFYCDGNDGTDGQPVKDGTNLGASCGQQTYGVKLKYNYAEGSLSFVGYAWNDATGYISMNSLNGGTVKYGLKVGVKTEAHPDEGAIIGDHQDLEGSATPYAWSQSLTWINFTGVRAEVELQIILGCEDENYIGVCPCVIIPGTEDCKDDDNEPGVDDLEVYAQTSPEALAAFPIADGVEYYAIRLKFKDLNGNPISKETLINDYNVRIFFQWVDTVKRDQVTGSAVNSNLIHLQKPFTDGAGAVTFKPVFLTNGSDSTAEFLEDGAPGTILPKNKSTLSLPTTIPEKSTIAEGSTSTSNMAWVGNDLVVYVKSLAPTTGGNKSKVLSLGTNIYRENDVGLCKTYNSDKTACLEYLPEKNNLILKSINWAIQQKSPLGPVVTGGTTYPNSGSHLDFRPALEVNTLNTASQVLEHKDTLVLYRNVLTKLEVGAIKNWNNISIIGQQAPKIKFNSTYNENIKYSTQDGADFNYTDSTDYSDWTGIRNLNIKWGTKSGEVLEDYIEGIIFRSIVEYFKELGPAYTVSYYSNFLPRTDSSIANPVAVIQGTLYGTGTTTQTGVTITEIGDNNVNIVKDTVYENVKKIIRDRNITQASSDVSISNDLESCENKCSIIPVADQKILYIKGKNAIISSDTSWTGHKVIVVDGGNLFIDGNLYNGNSTDNKIDPKNSLGIVVIRNTGEDLKNAGNIYIAPNVTNIQAFAVVWGAIFSYDGGAKTADRFEEYGSFAWSYNEVDMIDSLNKQLIWQGGISSNNTIGGVDESDAYYKTGYRVLPKDEDGLFAARLYDLNYFRYFRKKLIYDNEGNAVDTSCRSTEPPYAEIEGETCDDIDLDDMVIDEENKAQGALDTETNPFYIKYVPPYSKSVIFNKEKSLTF